MQTCVAKVRVSRSTQGGADKLSSAQYPKYTWRRLTRSEAPSTTTKKRTAGSSDPQHAENLDRNSRGHDVKLASQCASCRELNSRTKVRSGWMTRDHLRRVEQAEALF